MRPERPESRKLPTAIRHGIIEWGKTGLVRASPKVTGRFFRHLTTSFADEGHGKRVSRCIRILSNKARHELVIITKHGRDSLVVITAEEWERLKWARQGRGSTVELTKEQMEAIRTARGSEEFAHVDAELK
jgi:PHD/YefM family antitoxin component YafN of YafNO toxin-antitoxin module